jgi:hypothetical protein
LVGVAEADLGGLYGSEMHLKVGEGKGRLRGGSVFVRVGRLAWYVIVKMSFLYKILI